MKIYVVTLLPAGEVLTARTSFLAAVDMVKSRTGKVIRWQYSDSHGPCWTCPGYAIHETDLK